MTTGVWWGRRRCWLCGGFAGSGKSLREGLYLPIIIPLFMLRYHLLLSGLLLLSFLSGQDQKLIDSLETELAGHPAVDTARGRLLKILFDATSNNDLDRAEGYARQLLREGERDDSPYFRALGVRLLAIAKDYQGQKDSAYLLYRTAIGMYAEQQDSFSQGVLLYNLASLYQEEGLFDTAWVFAQRAEPIFASPAFKNGQARLAHLRASLQRERKNYTAAFLEEARAYELALEIQDSFFLQDVTQGIALTHLALEEYDLALRYYEENLEYQHLIHDDYSATFTLIQIGEVYWNQRNYARATEYTQRALDEIDRLGFTDLATQARVNQAGIFRDQGNYEAAERSYQRVLPTLADDFDKKNRAEVLISLAGIKLQLGKLREAERFGAEGLQVARRFGFPRWLAEAHQYLAELSARRGNYAAAYRHRNQQLFYRDSTYQIERTRSLAEFTAKFERERQDRLIGEQKSRLSLLETQAQVDRLQRTGLIAGLIGSLLLFTGVWSGLRQRNLRLKAERERLSAEVVGHQKELSTHALQMAQKGRLLDQLGEELRQIKGERPDDRKKLHGLIRELGSEERIDQDWANFRTYFQGVHGDFEERLKSLASTTLSPREWRLAALIKMQLNNQEVGAILGVSQDSLYKAKYRLRKKLPGATEGDLDGFLREV
ncbi:MAG: tetratricopeptide repeat protein [Bacteroidota bacterium]